MTLFDAFYFMSYTATTIGFGELPWPFTTAQRSYAFERIQAIEQEVAQELPRGIIVPPSAETLKIGKKCRFVIEQQRILGKIRGMGNASNNRSFLGREFARNQPQKSGQGGFVLLRDPNEIMGLM